MSRNLDHQQVFSRPLAGGVAAAVLAYAHARETELLHKPVQPPDRARAPLPAGVRERLRALPVRREVVLTLMPVAGKETDVVAPRGLEAGGVPARTRGPVARLELGARELPVPVGERERLLARAPARRCFRLGGGELPALDA